MKFWINNDSNTENVVVLTETGILIGSCDKENTAQANSDLNAGVSPAEVLGTEGMISIPYNQIQGIRSLSTDDYVCVDYRANKDIENNSIDFGSEAASEQFLSAIEKQLPDTLNKKVRQQSVLSSAVWPMFSLALCIGTSFLFFNKLRLVVYAVGGVWALMSVLTLLRRVRNPPEITSWTIKGKHVRKVWHGIKTAGSMAVATAIVVGVSHSLPDSHGPNALVDRLAHEMLTADEVQTLVDRGANLNSPDADGYTPLMLAIDWSEYDVATAMVQAGADLGVMESVELSMLEYALYDGYATEALLSAMLQRGGLNDAQSNGFDVAQYAEDNDDDTILQLMDRHNLVADSGQ